MTAFCVAGVRAEVGIAGRVGAVEALAHPRIQLGHSIFNHGAGLGIDVEVVQRPRAKGFEPLPKRWVIERTFGWLMQHRRLARDYEALPQRSRTMIHWAMANKMSREPTEESTPTWRIETDTSPISG